MVCHTMSAQVAAINLVVEAVKDGVLARKAINDSLRRLDHLKSQYVCPTGFGLLTPTPPRVESRNREHKKLAWGIYAKSTTVLRSSPGMLPLPRDDTKSIIFVSPGKAPASGGAVESGEEKTRVPYTPVEYVNILRAHNKSIKDIRFREGQPFTSEEVKIITEADIVILATRNASLNPEQKKLGLDLGTKLGDKLIVVATCDPYDFRDEVLEIKTYITIYEPTIPAFQWAANVMFATTEPTDYLPVRPGMLEAKPPIGAFIPATNPEDAVHAMWRAIFPNWPIPIDYLTSVINKPIGKHVICSTGFCLSFLSRYVHGRIAVVGVLPEYRGKGMGTFLLRRARGLLELEASKSGGLKTLSLGSVFPRFWPGVPTNVPQEHKNFFAKRGMPILLFLAGTARSPPISLARICLLFHRADHGYIEANILQVSNSVAIQLPETCT
jgi:beta-N-acetylhexosaminidase